MSEINIKRNIAFTTGSQAITMVAAFVVNWYLARFLGPELRGQYVYLFTLNSVLWLLLDLGVSKSIMVSMQRDKADPRALYSMSLVFFALSFLVSYLVFRFFPLWRLGLESYSRTTVFALSLYIAMFQLHNRQKVISIGANRIVDYSLLLTLPTVLFLLVILPMFWVFPASKRMEGAYLLNVGVMFLITLFFDRRIYRQISFKFIWDIPLIKRSYAMGFKAFLSEYLAIMMTRVDVLLLKHFGSFEDLGVYMLAINFIDIINVTGNMIGVVLLNKFAALNNDKESLEILRRVFALMIIFNTICILGMALLGHFVIPLLYTNAYIGAYKAFMYLVPAIFGLTLGSLFNTFLWSKGFPIFTIIAPAITSLLKVIVASLLIPLYGFYGAALSSSLVYPLWFIMLLTWYFTAHKEQKFKDLLVRKEDLQSVITMLLQLRSKAGIKA